MDLERATASMRAENLATLDFGDIVNDLMHGPAVPATVSFRVQWSGITRRVRPRDAANGWRGEFVEDTATLEWSSTEAALTFVSDPANLSHTEFAMLGRERNGVFFS